MTLIGLLLVAVPLKHFFGWPLGVRILGPLHGLAFSRSAGSRSRPCRRNPSMWPSRTGPRLFLGASSSGGFWNSGSSRERRRLSLARGDVGMTAAAALYLDQGRAPRRHPASVCWRRPCRRHPLPGPAPTWRSSDLRRPGGLGDGTNASPRRPYLATRALGLWLASSGYWFTRTWLQLKLVLVLLLERLAWHAVGPPSSLRPRAVTPPLAHDTRARDLRRRDRRPGRPEAGLEVMHEA